MIGNVVNANLAHLALIDWQEKEEIAREKAIGRARKYYGGDQIAYLSARLKEILALETVGAVDPDKLFHLNIARKVVTAFVERLNVTGFTSPDQKLADWAKLVWQVNRFDAQQRELFKMVKRDGEAFVIADWLNDEKCLRLTVHPRFVTGDNDGDDFGCRAEYENDNLSQPMRYAVKRWIEAYDPDDEESNQYWTTEQKQAKSRKRMTMYFPDHIEKYAQVNGRWQLTQDPGDLLDANGWVPWFGKDGRPLGIPVTHLKNDELECEIDSTVVSMQNLLNKTLIDLAESSDQNAFPVWVALGFVPTMDGKPLASDGSNRADVKPGSVIGSLKGPQEASLDRKPGQDATPIINIVNQIMLWVAQAKDLPPSRFLLGGQTPAAETQKQLDSPLLSHIAQLHTSLGDSFEDMFYIARRISNTFGGTAFDEAALLETAWANPAIRSDDRDAPLEFWQAVAAAVQAVPGLSVAGLLERYGWSKTEIDNVTGDGVMRDLSGTPITQ
jgi:hypothetical protein